MGLQRREEVRRDIGRQYIKIGRQHPDRWRGIAKITHTERQ